MYRSIKPISIIFIIAISYIWYNNDNYSKHSSGLVFDNIESIAACEVSTDKNNGRCVKELGTKKDTCVSSTAFGPVCSGNI